MRNTSTRDIDRILAEQSAALLEAMQRGEEGAQARLAAWLGESRRHVQHYLMMVALDRELATLDAEGKWDLGSNEASSNHNVVPMPRTASTPPSAPSQRRWLGAVAAALVASVLAIAGIYYGLGWHPGSREFSTALGEQRVVELDDGSVVHLNTQSRLEVRFSDTKRDIRLLTGEALFKVHHDVSRPFRVLTSDAAIQALGTEFNVYRREEGTTVSVLEGRVSVVSGSVSSKSQVTAPSDTEAQHTQASTRAARLEAGQRARVDAGRIAVTRVDDMGELAVWRQRRLIFKSTPLPEIVAEFNRYNRVPHLELRGPAAAERAFSGIFDADDPESLIDLLRGEPGLTLEQHGDAVTIR
jgi:transmembrane sensor